MLADIQRGRTSKPPRILLYGVERIGKSTFGSPTQKPIFIQTEDGLDEIDCDRFPPAATFDEVAAALPASLSRVVSVDRSAGKFVDGSVLADRRFPHAPPLDTQRGGW